MQERGREGERKVKKNVLHCVYAEKEENKWIDDDDDNNKKDWLKTLAYARACVFVCAEMLPLIRQRNDDGAWVSVCVCAEYQIRTVLSVI